MKEKLHAVDPIELQKMDLSRHLKKGEYVVPLIGEVVDSEHYQNWSTHLVSGGSSGSPLHGRAEKVGYVISAKNSPIILVNPNTVYTIGEVKLDITLQGETLKDVMRDWDILPVIQSQYPKTLEHDSEKVIGWRIGHSKAYLRAIKILEEGI